MAAPLDGHGKPTMLVSPHSIPDQQTLNTDVCIIGAGPAGLAAAQELLDSGLDVILLESGGEEPDAATQQLAAGVSEDTPDLYPDIVWSHDRRFGGTSVQWDVQVHGTKNCHLATFDPIDFKKRDWMPYSGWPIDYDTMHPYYLRALKLWETGVDSLEMAPWVSEERKLLDFKGNALETKLYMTGSQAVLTEGIGGRIKQSQNMRLIMKANAVELDTNEDASTVTGVKVACLDGRRFTIAAKQVILAQGGFQVPRLLLASNRQQSAGIGNRYDLVGRYFQDHPRFLNGIVDFAEPYRNNPLFDIKFHCIVNKVKIGGVDISGQMRIPFEVQKERGILDAQMWFRSLYAGEGTDVVRALYRMRQRVRGKWSPFVGLGTDLGHIFSHPMDSLTYSVAHTTGSLKLVRYVTMELIAEPEPDPNSRVMLSDDVDALGMRRTKIDWRLSQRVKDTVDTSFELLARELEDKKIAKVTLGPRINDVGWPADMEGTYHHMGTTRMADSPREGVVDRNCLVHGMENLYIAGSSVFPTSSSNNPTMTLVALALRLTDRLVDEFRAGTHFSPEAKAAEPAKAEDQPKAAA